MKPNFNPTLVDTFIRILLVLLAVKILWFIMELVWFPAAGVNHAEDHNAKPLYYKVKLTPNEAPAPKKKTVVKKPVGSIKDITLLAIYDASDITVVTVEYKGKSKVLGKGDTINGFVLEGAGKDFAIFEKNGKSYQVTLVKPKRKGEGNIQLVQPEKSETKSVPREEEESGEIIDAGDHKIVERSLFDHYAKNMDEIYKNIGIKEIKRGDRIEGFRITFVRRGSPFAKLGVKRGDVIKSVNGQELTSYNAAFEAYKNMGDAQSITLVIQRGNKEMELEYEIN